MSGLISSICCNHECIQITTFPCADHMFVPQTEGALSLGSGGRRDRGRDLKERRRGGADVGREPPAAPGSRPDLRLGFVRSGSRCSVQLPAAFSPPPPAPPPGLLLLFNIHLEKLNLASWKPAHSQIPGDFQSLSFSPSRDATFPPAEASEKPSSFVPASPSLHRGGPAAHPEPDSAPRRKAAREGSRAPAPR